MANPLVKQPGPSPLDRENAKAQNVLEGNRNLPEALREKAVELGFAAIGIAPADAAPQAGERLRQWLAEGAHGDMIWMAETAERRASPAGLWPEVRSVISLGMSYAPASDPLALAGSPERGRISVYAQGADYHDVVKKALKALARWLVEAAGCELKVFVDTAPVMEKPLAEAAGIGWQGKHTNLVSRTDGSWLFLGAIYTTLDRRLSCAVPARCAALHLLSHHRAQRADPGRIPPGDRQSHLWLRRLSRRLPVEPLRRCGARQPGVPAPGRACRARAWRPAGA